MLPIRPKRANQAPTEGVGSVQLARDSSSVGAGGPERRESAAPDTAHRGGQPPRAHPLLPPVPDPGKTELIAASDKHSALPEEISKNTSEHKT